MENTSQNQKPTEVGNLFKRLKGRLNIVLTALTTKNIMLVTVNEFTENNGEKGRNVSVITRTDYSHESDYLTLKGAVLIKEKLVQ